MVERHPIVRSVTMSVLALVRHHSTLNPLSERAKREVWWPFITKMWMDMCMYGFCAFVKKNKRGVIVPEYVPIVNCHIIVLSTGKIEIRPQFGKFFNTERKIYVHVAEEPNYRTGFLNSPLARVLSSFRRLSQLGTYMIEQEASVTHPIVYLEDTVTRSGGSICKYVLFHVSELKLIHTTHRQYDTK
jgi:hypothetical protein